MLSRSENEGLSQRRGGRRVLARLVAGAVFALPCVGVLGQGSAWASSAPIHIAGTGGQGVYIRQGPGTSYPTLGLIPEGASPDFSCYSYGQMVGNVDVWFSVSYKGASGYYASYYDDSSYSSAANLTAKYGIPQCGQAASPPSAPAAVPAQVQPPAPVAAVGPTAAENAAMGWARRYADAHSGSYAGLCLTFVFQAYAAAGVNLRPWVAVPIGGNTYPMDIWGHFSHGSTGGGTPPAGALVFFEPRNGNRYYSHVALSLGSGNLISTEDGVASDIHYETLAQHSYANYLGWWLPDA